ncbi:AarF/ABC1/UbiB kinase family protein [Hydrogenobacter thermophilus]|uniref:ABC1 kinase family protein n=1 Tax=Hydrogenobacter thermophilus TaxID=940 RepID=UPI0030FA21C8
MLILMGHIKRKAQMAKVMAKHGFGLLLFRLGLGHLVPFHWGLFGHRKKEKPYRPEEHLRLAFEELGPTFIKLGQILSVRPDLLPEEYIDELSKLQDRVPPSDTASIKKVMEEELGKSVEELFEYFEETPIASASIGQVHRAILKSGEKVVLKVQKPEVEKQIMEDLEVFEELIETVTRSELGRRWDLRSLFEEFSYTIKNELDYIREGRNCDTFRKNFKGDPDIYIPKVFWEYTTRKVLCLEYVGGIKINSLEELKREGHDLKRLARKGTGMYLKMIFRDGFFHADPHPGNLLVMKDGRIALLDHGMVGTIDSMGRLNLFQLMYGIVKGDTDLVMDAVYDLGVQTKRGSDQFLKRELEILFSYYFMQPIREIKLSKIVNDTLKLSYKYGMKIPSDLYLLLKTLALAEGTGIQLDPNFRLIEKIEPVVKRGFRQMILPMLTKREVLRNTLMATKLGLQAVSKTKKFLRDLERGEVRVSVDYTGEERLIEDLRKDINRLAMSVITLGFLLMTTLIVLFVAPYIIKEYIVYAILILTLFMLIYGFMKLKAT